MKNVRSPFSPAAAEQANIWEDGTGSDHCNVEKPWQAASLVADAMAADLFWQWGDIYSNGQKSPNDGNTIYYGSSDAQCLITDHVKAMSA